MGVGVLGAPEQHWVSLDAERLLLPHTAEPGSAGALSALSPPWGAEQGLAGPSAGDEPTELGAAGTKLGQPGETAPESPSGSEGRAKDVLLFQQAKHLYPKIWEVLVGLCCPQFWGQIAGEQHVPSVFPKGKRALWKGESWRCCWVC